MMDLENNIRAVLETNFTESKDEIIDVATSNLLRLMDKDEPKPKDEKEATVLSLKIRIAEMQDTIRMYTCYDEWMKIIQESAEKIGDFDEEDGKLVLELFYKLSKELEPILRSYE